MEQISRLDRSRERTDFVSDKELKPLRQQVCTVVSAVLLQTLVTLRKRQIPYIFYEFACLGTLSISLVAKGTAVAA